MGRVRAWVGRREGGRDRRGWLRGAPPPGWVRALPLLLVLGVATAGQLSAGPLDIGFLLGAIPPLAVLSYGPLGTAVLGALSVVLLLAPEFQLNNPGHADMLTVCFVALLSVFVSFVRSRRDAQLDMERMVAEAAQHAVVPPVPARVGPVRCTALYRAAQEGTLVGGDFFDVRDGPHGIRVVLGDVQGHGLKAVSTVALLLGAFREAVLDQPDLESVAGRLDRRLLVDAEQARREELFATAVLLEFSPDAATARVVTCGHPPPVLLRDGAAMEIGSLPWTPLGLGLSGTSPPEGHTVWLHPGDRLFLASDGVWEARSPDGAFYPLPERLTLLAAGEPDTLAERVWADVLRFSGPTVVRDDVTMLVLASA